MRKYFSGYFNLLKTTIGSGILSYPFIFMTYGYGMAILISCIAASISFFGLFLYLLCMQDSEPRSTFSSLAKNSILKSNILSNLIICIKCIGVSISYLVIIRQLLPLIFAHAFPNMRFITPRMFLFIQLLLISPLTYLKEINKLQYTSICGLLCIILVVFTSFYRFITTENISKDVIFVTPMSTAWITGIGKVVFSFTCHQNIFSVHNELEENNTKKSSLLALYTIFTALVIYLIFGILNYSIYGTSVNIDILETFPHDRITTFIQFLYVLVMGFSYPLQIYPCRIYMIQMINPSLKKYSNIVEILVTTVLLIFTYSVAACNINLGTVYSLIGSIASSLVCMIFPVIFYKSIVVVNSRINFMANIVLMIGLCIFASSIFNVSFFNIPHDRG